MADEHALPEQLQEADQALAVTWDRVADGRTEHSLTVLLAAAQLGHDLQDLLRAVMERVVDPEVVVLLLGR